MTVKVIIVVTFGWQKGLIGSDTKESTEVLVMFYILI